MKEISSVDSFNSLARCPICSKKYKQGDSSIIKEEDGKTIFHMTCGSCEISSLVFVSHNQMGVVSMGIITDLEKDEARKVIDARPISANQIIDAYKFLKNFSGNIEKLIS